MQTETKTQKKVVDVNATVTENFINQLAHGVIPWKHPYASGGLPLNPITGKHYRGINIWILSSLNYPTNHFITFKQLKEKNGAVKKDEKAHEIVFWNWTEMQDKDSTQSARIPFMRLQSVFNIAQCEGISAEDFPMVKNLEGQGIQLCEEIIEKFPNLSEIQNKGKVAIYNPFEDIITLPPMKSFNDMESYYEILFYLLIHSTGHPKRLNRKDILSMENFTGDPFSVEELIADIGASYLKFYCGIPLINSNTNITHLEKWMGKLKHDKKLIVYACSVAQKAVDYILNVKFDEFVTATQPTPETVEDDLPY